MNAWWVLVLFVQPQDPIPIPPSKKSKVEVIEPETGEILVKFEAEEARPEGDRVVRLIRVRAVVNTRNKEKKVKRLIIEAESGRYDQATEILRLEGQVRFMGEEGERYDSRGGLVQFKEKRFEADQEFRLEKPGVVLRGQSLKTNLALEEHEIGGTPRIIIIGDPQKAIGDLSRTDPGDLKIRTIVECEGTARIRDAKERIEISTAAPTKVSKRDERGEFSARARSAIVRARRQEGRAVAEGISMKGDVRAEDSSPFVLEGDALDWEEASDEVVVPTAKLSLKDDQVMAEKITFRRGKHHLIAERSVRASFQKLLLDAETLDIQLESGAARRLTAEGRPRIRREGITITGRRFFFDVAGKGGTVFGDPMAHVVQEGLEAWAPVLAVREESVVASGPKLIRFGERSAGCDGDLRIRGRVAELTRNVWLAGSDLGLQASQAQVRFGKDNAVEQLQAGGGVRVRVLLQGGWAAATGARLVREGEKEVRLEGLPLTTMAQGAVRLTANLLTFDLARHTFTATKVNQRGRLVFEEPDK